MPLLPGWPIAPIMLALATLLVAHATFASDTASTVRDDPALDRLVADVCARDVVALGEDAGHGSGLAIEVRAWLVRRLVSECGFSAVAFESQIYDFMALEEANAAGSLSREAVADAIGGLWSTVAESEELIDFLTAQATARRVRLLARMFHEDALRGRRDRVVVCCAEAESVKA